MKKSAQCVSQPQRRWLPSLWTTLHSSSWKWVNHGVLLAQYLNSCTSSTGTEGENPQTPPAYGFIYLISSFFGWSSMFHVPTILPSVDPCLCFTNRKESNSDFFFLLQFTRWFMQRIYTLMLCLIRLSSGPASQPHCQSASKSLLLANKPLGGNISPAVPFPILTGFSGGLQFSTLSLWVPIPTLCVLENCRHTPEAVFQTGRNVNAWTENHQIHPHMQN